MDWNAILSPLFNFLGQYPTIGHILQILAAVVAGLTVTVTGFVALWHALWGFVSGLAQIPGLSKLQGFADWLKQEEDALSSFSQKILGVLDRLSVIPIPKAAPAPAPVANTASTATPGK